VASLDLLELWAKEREMMARLIGKIGPMKVYAVLSPPLRERCLRRSRVHPFTDYELCWCEDRRAYVFSGNVYASPGTAMAVLIKGLE
jgi:hypothetical protein